MVLRVRIKRCQQRQRGGIIGQNPAGVPGEANEEHTLREPGLRDQNNARAALLMTRSKDHAASVELASEISSSRADYDWTASLFRAAGDVESVQADHPVDRGASGLLGANYEIDRIRRQVNHRRAGDADDGKELTDSRSE